MLADINLRFLCQVFQAFFVFVELYDCLGKFVRLILDEENFFYIRDSLAADGGGDDGGTVIDSFYHLALNPCAVAVEKIREVRKEYPDVAVVCYVNSMAEIKAESDVCVTSSNALKIVKKLPNKDLLSGTAGIIKEP